MKIAALPPFLLALSPNEMRPKTIIKSGYKVIGNNTVSSRLTPFEPEIITTNQTGKPNKLSNNKNINPKYELNPGFSFTRGDDSFPIDLFDMELRLPKFLK
jgi:hypothetical protein